MIMLVMDPIRILHIEAYALRLNYYWYLITMYYWNMIFYDFLKLIYNLTNFL